MFYTVCHFKYGYIKLVGDINGLLSLTLIPPKGIHKSKEKEANNKLIRNDDFFNEIISQLNEYFLGKRKTFNIKLNLFGTEFQKKVWRKLINIPYGSTCSYKDIATAIGRPKAFRAVGTANRKNPIPIIIPCHRVIATNGKLSGYVYGKAFKKQLLDLEKKETILSNKRSASYFYS